MDKSIELPLEYFNKNEEVDNSLFDPVSYQSTDYNRDYDAYSEDESPENNYGTVIPDDSLLKNTSMLGNQYTVQQAFPASTPVPQANEMSLVNEPVPYNTGNTNTTIRNDSLVTNNYITDTYSEPLANNNTYSNISAATPVNTNKIPFNPSTVNNNSTNNTALQLDSQLGNTTNTLNIPDNNGLQRGQPQQLSTAGLINDAFDKNTVQINNTVSNPQTNSNQANSLNNSYGENNNYQTLNRPIPSDITNTGADQYGNSQVNTDNANVYAQDTLNNTYISKPQAQQPLINTYPNPINSTDSEEYTNNTTTNKILDNSTVFNSENTVTSNNNSQQTTDLNELNGKIQSLQSQIKNLKQRDKETFFNFVDNNGTSSFNDTNNSIEVFNNNNSLEKNNLVNSLNYLLRQKERILKESNNNLTNNNITSNDTAYTNIPNTDPSFVPNLSDNSSIFNNTKSDSNIELAVMTEKLMGGDPKIVNNNGQPVVISKNQNNIQNAISQHGGPEAALKDSVKNQSFVSNLVNSQLPSQTTPVLDNNTVLPPRDNAVANNTSKIIEMLSDISISLKDVSNSIKGISTKNNNNNSTVNNNSGDKKINTSMSNNPPAQASNNANSSSGNSNTSTMPAGIKNNYPLSQDFPTGFDVTSLGGSNLH